MKKIWIGCLAGLLALGAGADPVVIDGNAWDRAWFEDGSSANGVNERIGGLTTFGGGRNASVVFELPVLSSGESVADADLTVELTAVKNSPLFNVDVYGVSFSPTGAEPPREYYEGVFQSSENGNTGLIDDFFVPTDSPGSFSSAGAQSTAIGAWIQGFYDANTDYSGGVFAVFRFNPDADAGTTDVGFDIASANNATEADRPSLTLNVIPEPATAGFFAVSFGIAFVLRKLTLL